MAIQLLRNCRVAIRKEGVIYPLYALGDISLSSSISQVTIPRKTLFNNTPRPKVVTGKVNPTSISLSLTVSKDISAGILLESIGLTNGNGSYVYPNTLNNSPELFELLLVNSETSIVASPCFLESIDISLTKSSNLVLDCTISAANIEVDDSRNPVHNIAYEAVEHSPIDLKINRSTFDRVRSASISIQQECSWVDDRSLFDGLDTYKHNKAVLNNMILSANATVNHSKDIINIAEEAEFTLGQSGLQLYIENARITNNFNLESVYSTRFDVFVTDNSGTILITLES